MLVTGFVVNNTTAQEIHKADAFENTLRLSICAKIVVVQPEKLLFGKLKKVLVMG